MLPNYNEEPHIAIVHATHCISVAHEHSTPARSHAGTVLSRCARARARRHTFSRSEAEQEDPPTQRRACHGLQRVGARRQRARGGRPWSKRGPRNDGESVSQRAIGRVRKCACRAWRRIGATHRDVERVCKCTGVFVLAPSADTVCLEAESACVEAGKCLFRSRKLPVWKIYLAACCRGCWCVSAALLSCVIARGVSAV